MNLYSHIKIHNTEGLHPLKIDFARKSCLQTDANIHTFQILSGSKKTFSIFNEHSHKSTDSVKAGKLKRSSHDKKINHARFNFFILSLLNSSVK